MSKSTQLGFAYEYLYSGDPKISKTTDRPIVLGGRGNLSGDYPNMSNQFFSVNMTHKF